LSYSVFFCLPARQAYTYTLPDNTLVEKSNGGYADVIGDPAVFDIYGIDYGWSGSSLSFSIYTNYPEGGKLVGDWDTRPGHFAIDANGDYSFEYALVLSNNDFDGKTKGSWYSVQSWHQATHYYPQGSQWTYIHGLYPVTVNDGVIPEDGSGKSLDPLSVNWVANTEKQGTYRINFAVPANYLGLNPGDSIGGVRWAVATCANDVISSPVPEPTTLLLLGSGLLGLAAVGVRKKNSVV